MATTQKAPERATAAGEGKQPVLATHPSTADLLGEPISLEAINERWVTATIDPERRGSWTKLGRRLRFTIDEVVRRVAMVNVDAFNESEIVELSAELEEMLRVECIRRLHARGLARSGYEDIGVRPEPVR